MQETSESKGELLESELKEFLITLFKEFSLKLIEARQEHRGLQRGRDLIFEFKDPQRRTQHWHVEAKNWKKPIPNNELSGKLLLIKTLKQTDPKSVTRWILVSPKSNLSNDAREVFKSNRKDYNFAISFLIPSIYLRNSYTIKDLLKILPQLYEKIYKKKAPSLSTEEINKIKESFKSFVEEPDYKFLIEQLLNYSLLGNWVKEESSKPDAFYLEKDISWGNIHNDCNITRCDYDRIKAKLSPVEQQSNLYFLILLSGMGGGKSTLLKSLAYNLFNEGKFVLFFNDLELNFEEIQQVRLYCGERVYLFIDNASEYVEELDKLYRQWLVNKFPLTVVGADKNNRWNQVYLDPEVRSRLRIPTSSLETLPLSPLNDTEAICLRDKIVEKLGGDTKYASQISSLRILDSKRIIEITKKLNGNISMITFEFLGEENIRVERHLEEYDRFPSDIKRAYNLVASLSRFGIKCPHKLLALFLKISPGSFGDFLRRINGIFARTTDLLWIENESIADAVCKQKLSETDQKEIYKEIITLAKES